MPAFIADAVFDAALNYIKDSVENLYITSNVGVPDTFAKASSTNKLGTKATPVVTGPIDHTTGRKVTVSAISDGAIGATGVAQYFALTDDSASLLLCYQELAATQSVTLGNTFTLTAVIIAIPDPTA